MPPTAPPASPFLAGALSVRAAMAEFSLSRQRLWELMQSGVVAWRVLDRRGARLLSRSDLARYVESLPQRAG